MKKFLTLKSFFVLMVIVFLAAAVKIEAQKRRAIRIIEGTVTGYECGDNCYLTITDKNGKQHAGLCSAHPLCTKWNREVMMPDRYKGKRVKVTIGKGTLFTGMGDVVGTTDAFTRIQLITPPSSVLDQPVETNTKQSRVTTFSAKSGFYIQLWMCHACAYYGWQKNTVSALGKAAVQAFVSDDPNSGYHQTEQRYFDLQSLRLRRVIASRRVTEDWSTPVYAGPFDSEQTARQVFSQFTSILTPILDEIDKSGSRELTDCSGNHCELSRYTVQLVRVQR